MVSKATVVCQRCRVRLRSTHTRRENASDLHLHMQVQPMQEPTFNAEAIPRTPDGHGGQYGHSSRDSSIVAHRAGHPQCSFQPSCRENGLRDPTSIVGRLSPGCALLCPSEIPGTAGWRLDRGRSRVRYWRENFRPRRLGSAVILTDVESRHRAPGMRDPPAGQKGPAGWGGLECGARWITYVASLLLRKVLRLSSGLCLGAGDRGAVLCTRGAGRARNLVARDGIAASNKWLLMRTDGCAKVGA